MFLEPRTSICQIPLAVIHAERRRLTALDRRAAAIRAELNLIRSQLENGRNGPRRKLLDDRFDAVQHRAADIHARLLSMGAP
jgi:hypothetical protein